MNAYVDGQTHTMVFGGNWEQDRFGICLYGDALDGGAGFQMEAATAQTPEQAGLCEHQMFSVWAHFQKPQSYADLFTWVDRLHAIFEKLGWDVYKAPNHGPTVGSAINDLTFNAGIESSRMYKGYNAGHDFTVVMHKEGAKPTFSENEIEAILKAVKECIIEIFGRELLLRE